MPTIRPITDLRNTNEISEMCHSKNEPIFITKNGYGDMVVMSMEAYDQIISTGKIDAAITSAEAEYNENGKSYVFTISENKAVKNEIITGQKLGSYFEVIRGLQPGQKVINSLNEKVIEGVEVKLEE